MSATDAGSPVCLTTLLRICGGNEEFASMLLGKFQTAAPMRVSGIEEGIQSGDTSQVRHMAHALKGSAASLGITEISQLAALIEVAARGDDLSSVDEPLEQLAVKVRECTLLRFS